MLINILNRITRTTPIVVKFEKRKILIHFEGSELSIVCPIIEFHTTYSQEARGTKNVIHS